MKTKTTVNKKQATKATETNGFEENKSKEMVNKKNPWGFSNVFFMGKMALNWDSLRVYRYVPFSRAKSMINEKKLTFLSPDLWEDPFEKRYYDVKVVNDGKEKKVPKMACLCTTSSGNENAAAFWNCSRGSSETYLRLTLDLYKLCEILNSFAKKNKAKIYVSAMNYDYDRKEIEKIYKDKDFMSEKQLDDLYVKLMSLKRKEFKYENEIRFFIVWSDESKFPKFDESKKIEVGIKKIDSLITSILIEPNLDSISKIDVIYEMKLYKKGTKGSIQTDIASFIDKLSSKISVKKCQLYMSNKCRVITWPIPKKTK